MYISYKYVYIHIYTYKYVQMHMYIYIHTYAHPHTHTRTHTNTHTHTGGVMGYSLCALSLMTLYCLCIFFRHIFETNGFIDYKSLFECVAGYGLGGSAIAMFGRVGGGIFTKVCV